VKNTLLQSISVESLIRLMDQILKRAMDSMGEIWRLSTISLDLMDTLSSGTLDRDTDLAGEFCFMKNGERESLLKLKLSCELRWNSVRPLEPHDSCTRSRSAQVLVSDVETTWINHLRPSIQKKTS
jgi:hypothetical protein